MNNKTDKSKSRQDSVFGTVNVGEDRILSVHYDWQTDRIEIESALKGSTRTERSYARESGKPKVISSIPSDGRSAFTAKKALFAYDWVVAVDTNTRTISGKRCGVCVSYFTPTPPSSCAKPGVPFICLAAYLIVGIRDGLNPEQIGWHFTITKNLTNPIPTNQRVAFVVDSEFGSHRDINDRKKGYYLDNLLPPQFTVVYSSSDTDNETLGGHMIRMCDTMSSRIFAQLELTGIPDVNGLRENDNYETVIPIGIRRE